MPRRRGPALVMVAGVVVAALAIAVALGVDERSLVANSSTAPRNVVTTLKPGEQACTARFTAPEDFTRVRVWPRSFGSRPPELALDVRPATGGPALARGVLRGRHPRGRPWTVPVGRGPGGRSLVLCARNAGGGLIALLGEAPVTPAGATVKDGRRLPLALAYDLLRSEPRSGLALVSTVFHRAALFRPAGVGPWTYWLLLALVLVAVPALLAGALREADASEVLGDPGGLAAEDEGSEGERADHHGRGER